MQNQLNLIRQYCDTTGMRLSTYEKNVLCKILENPAKYDGFTSQIYVEERSGKDHNGRWETVRKDQYRINIGERLSISCRWYHACDDGYVRDDCWDWANAVELTDVRRIIGVLERIRSEL